MQTILSALILLLTVPVFADEDLPSQPRGQCVLDEAKALDADSFNTLEASCEGLDRTGKGQIEIVVTDSLRGMTKEEFATELFQKWRIGHKDVSDGLLIVLKVGPPGQRSIRTEVGYGLEPVLTDLRTAELTRSLALPHLKEGQWGAGLIPLANQMIADIESSAKDRGETRASASSDDIGMVAVIFGMFFGGVGCILFGFWWSAKKRKGREEADRVAEKLREEKNRLDRERTAKVKASYNTSRQDLTSSVQPLTSSVSPQTPPKTPTPQPTTAKVYPHTDDLRAKQRLRDEERRREADAEARRRRERDDEDERRRASDSSWSIDTSTSGGSDPGGGFGGGDGGMSGGGGSGFDF